MLFLILFAFLQLALAGPLTFRIYKKDCDAKIEELDWKITNFVSFEKKAAANSSSYLHFDFADINDGLIINTTCSRTLPRNSTATLYSDQYYLCQNNTVRFMYEDNKTLQVSRWFEDECLGDYPYNSAIAFGRLDPNATRSQAIDGVYHTKTSMEMPISSMS